MNPGFFGAVSKQSFLLPGAETRQVERLYCAIAIVHFNMRLV